MDKIIWADEAWTPFTDNPYSRDGNYGAEWSAFIYDETQSFYSNVIPGTRVYVLSVNPHIDRDGARLRDFTAYENAHGRTVIVKAPAAERDRMLTQIQQSPAVPGSGRIREHDPHYLVHSTTAEAWTDIQQAGALLSPEELRRRGRNVHEIGLKTLLEPADYSDYVMLDVMGGCGEIVVNSRQLGYVCTDPDRPYTPGVRLYFDAHRLIADGLAVRDGLHVLKVKESLPLHPYMLTSVSADLLPEQTVWTPTTYTEAANNYFLEHV
ncbi:hypothetical protein [Paenibacillus tengchongensis]|uniref:hypothetical protein n=1 Tax=Paenibacillus tengchongensis TaxID=2608684 RepID=UPI00124E805C|nr:hypothetical protein [Paenibacillus tengchongensis]